MVKSQRRDWFPCMVTCVRLEVVGCGLRFGSTAKKAPAQRPGHQSQGEAQIRSVAAVHQPPARTPGGRDQAPHVAAAITAAVIGRAADEDAGTTPAPAVMMVPAMMPTAMVPATAPGRGRCR